MHTAKIGLRRGKALVSGLVVLGNTISKVVHNAEAGLRTGTAICSKLF
jgi:hypothetical protein